MAGKRILVVGAGFAGLYAALHLRRAVDLGHRVTVVNPENFMQYHPFLPEVASGTIDPRAVVVPLRSVLRHCEVVIGEVERVDQGDRTARVRLADGRQVALGYDVVVLAPGSWARVLPIPGLAGHGVGFKTVQEAIWLRNHVLSRLDLAAVTDDGDRRRGGEHDPLLALRGGGRVSRARAESRLAVALSSACFDATWRLARSA